MPPYKEMRMIAKSAGLGVPCNAVYPTDVSMGAFFHSGILTGGAQRDSSRLQPRLWFTHLTPV